MAEWDDIRDYVNGELALEGNSITDAHLKRLANQAVDIISESVRPLTHTWTGTDLTAEAEGLRLPSDMIGTPIVVTDGDCPVPMVDADYIEGKDDTWAYCYNITGLHLRTNVPLADLKIRAYKSLPYYNTGTETPMGNLPRAYKMLPAYYVLAMHIISPDIPREVARAQRYMSLFNDGLRAAEDAVRKRGSEGYRW